MNTPVFDELFEQFYLPQPTPAPRRRWLSWLRRTPKATPRRSL